MSDTTVLDSLSRVVGYEATNTNLACPEEPAPCGGWWIKLWARGDGPQELDLDDEMVQELVLATEEVDGGCELHVAEHVVGTYEIAEYIDTSRGNVHPIEVCAIDEHGHVARGHIDLLLPRGNVGLTREPCP